jgi:casein kinase II subunit beta
MSRRPQHQPSLDTSQPDVPEDELLSATGEGDEVMEEAEEQEGYSACQNPFPLTYSNNCRPSLPPSSYRPCVAIRRTPTDALPIASSHSPASSTPTSSLTWISWFCSLPGHDYFCEVAEDFIEDDFNLTGLNAMVPFWKEAMEMVLDVEPGAFPPTPELSSVSLTVSKTKTRPRSLMSRLSKHLQNCCMGLCINVTYLRELDSTRWSVSSH